MASQTTVPIDNSYAKTLKSLHHSSDPLVLSNVYDIPSTTTVLSLNTSSKSPVKALATASYAIAGNQGIADPDLTLSANLEAISRISPLARAAGLPISADLQDGYGAQLHDCISQAIDLGVVGANIEDSIREQGYGKGLDSLYPLDEQVARLKKVLEIAADKGVPDFVLNARTDVFWLNPLPEGWTHDDALKEAVRRGKAFLEAGATCVFVLGTELRLEDVKVLVKELEGRVSVILSDAGGTISVAQWKEIGVCRISVGPTLWGEAMNAVKKAAERILGVE